MSSGLAEGVFKYVLCIPGRLCLGLQLFIRVLLALDLFLQVLQNCQWSWHGRPCTCCLDNISGKFHDLRQSTFVLVYRSTLRVFSASLSLHTLVSPNHHDSYVFRGYGSI